MIFLLNDNSICVMLRRKVKNPVNIDMEPFTFVFRYPILERAVKFRVLWMHDCTFVGEDILDYPLINIVIISIRTVT